VMVVDVIAAAMAADADNLSSLAVTVQWVAWSDGFPRIALKNPFRPSSQKLVGSFVSIHGLSLYIDK